MTKNSEILLLDTHQHLIYPESLGYAWTEGIAELQSQFSIDDYHHLTEDLGVAGSLFMETAVDDCFYQEEAGLVHHLAQQKNAGILGQIASIRPESCSEFDAWLEQAEDFGIKGYRRVLHVEPDELSQSNEFRQNIRKLGAADKVFDVCVLERQLEIAVSLAKACDNTQLVLNHCGVPDISGNSFDDWKTKISQLAVLPNVACKLSGLLAYCPEDDRNLQRINPYIEHVIESFGCERIVWGSDWPVVNLANGLPDWIAVTRQILSALSVTEAEQIAHQNAERIYQVSLPVR